MDNELEIFETPKQNKKRLISTIVSMAVVVVLALVCAILLKTYVICTIPVGGDSMRPTLVGGTYTVDENGDTKTLTKGDTLFLNRIAKIERGDIVVFDVDFQSDPLVKRVIAIGGDTVEINNDGNVYVNGVALEEDYIEGKTYAIDSTISITVPEGHVFCLGDNRMNSHDSRFDDIGTVPLENIRGKCFLIAGADWSLRLP